MCQLSCDVYCQVHTFALSDKKDMVTKKKTYLILNFYEPRLKTISCSYTFF